MIAILFLCFLVFLITNTQHASAFKCFKKAGISYASRINQDIYQFGSIIQFAKKNKGKKSIEAEEEGLMRKVESLAVDNPLKSADDSIPQEVRVKIKEEIASPFRKFRQFFYISMGAAAGLGTFTAVPQLIFALQDGGDAISPAVTNVLIDIGGVVGSVLLWDRESSDEKAKLQRFAEKEKISSSKLTPEKKVEFENRLKMMPVEIQISEADGNATRIVSFDDLQKRGNQHIIVVAGAKSFVRDAILSARIEGNELFNSQETMVVPVVLEDDQLEVESKGFLKLPKESLMEAPYIAKPAQVNVWQRYLSDEIELASGQGANDLVKQGVVISVRRTGKVIGRGIGLPPWKQIIEEFNEKAKA